MALHASADGDTMVDDWEQEEIEDGLVRKRRSEGASFAEMMMKEKEETKRECVTKIEECA
jgi:hypothetical protein